MSAQNTESKSEEMSIKITITKQAGQVLSELLERVNDGFDAGRVHRQNLASWIIEDFHNSLTDSDIIRIRQTNYDASSMFDTVYRKMKETGEIPDFLKDALQKQFQNQGTGLKKSKKQLQPKYINDVLQETEEAA